MNEAAERARLKYKYRRLIMTGKLRLPLKEAQRLIGPDVAYHLYRVIPSTPTEKRRKGH